jgi:hypothetical protein
LTTAPRIKPTSIFLRSARRPNPGRRSTYRRGIIVQTTGTGSLTKDVAHLSLSVTDLNTAVTKKNNDYEARLRVLESKVEDQRSTSTTWRFVIGVGLPVVFACIGWLFLQTYTLNSTIDSRISRAINTSLTNYSLIKISS